MKTMNPDILDGSGFEPHKVRFESSRSIRPRLRRLRGKAGSLFFAVYVTPVWPQPRTELLLGPFHCVGCIVGNGVRLAARAYCSSPDCDALETLAHESATRKR